MKDAHASPWPGAWHMVCDKLLIRIRFCVGCTLVAGALQWDSYTWGSLAAFLGCWVMGSLITFHYPLVFLAKFMFGRVTFSLYTLPALISSLCTAVRVSCVSIMYGLL